MEEKGNEKYQADIHDEIVRRMRRLGHVIRGIPDGRGGQKNTLIALYKHGAMTQKVLTRKMGVKSASASELLQKLEGAGLVRKTQNLEDMRTADISLTEEGSRQARIAERESKEQFRELLSVLSEEEKEQFLACLKKLTGDV